MRYTPFSVQRRDFLTSTLGATLMAASGDRADAAQATGAKVAPEFYVWRRYFLKNGTQPRRLAEFLQGAAIPALNRLGHTPIGVFEVTFGLPAPTVFVLTPSSSLESLLAIEGRARARRRVHEGGRPVSRRAGERSGLRAPGAVAFDRVPERAPHRDSRGDRGEGPPSLRAAHV